MAAAAGACAGDLFGFALGKRYGNRLLKSHGKYLLLTEERFEQVRELIAKHRVKSALINRFNPLTRPIGPFISGASPLRFSSYAWLAAPSALSWAVFNVGGGFIFGRGIQVLAHYIGYAFITVIVFSLFMLYSYRFLNQGHQTFRKYYVYTLGLNILSAFVFVSTLEDVVNHEWITRLDHATLLAVPHIQSSFLTGAMILVTRIGDPVFLTFAAMVIIAYMLYRKSWYAALLSSLSLSSGLFLQYAVKVVTDVSRPSNPLVDTLYASFPSGHATMVTIFCILLGWAFSEHFKSVRAKALFYVALGSLVVLVGFSRVYLQAHWPSDVLAGVSLGIFSTTFFMIFLHGIIWSHQNLIRMFRRHEKPVA
jgi:undecaprenyl-diphosphatase